MTAFIDYFMQIIFCDAIAILFLGQMNNFLFCFILMFIGGQFSRGAVIGIAVGACVFFAVCVGYLGCLLHSRVVKARARTSVTV
jgi:hypothetical protein